MLSCNINIYGHEKDWTGISSKYYTRLEDELAPFLGAESKVCSKFLRHKNMIVTDQFLRDRSIPFTKTAQKEGEIIITLPGGLHFGHNNGFNKCIAHNLTTKRWLSFGIDSKLCWCTARRVNIPIYSLLPSYLSKDEYTAWKNKFIKPESFFYTTLKPVRDSHYIMQPHPRKELLRKGRKYRLEESRTETYKYVCIDSKCKCRVLCDKNYEFKREPDHKADCKNHEL